MVLLHTVECAEIDDSIPLYSVTFYIHRKAIFFPCDRIRLTSVLGLQDMASGWQDINRAMAYTGGAANVKRFRM